MSCGRQVVYEMRRMDASFRLDLVGNLPAETPRCAEVRGNLKDCKLGGWVVLLVGIIMLWESVRVAQYF